MKKTAEVLEQERIYKESERVAEINKLELLKVTLNAIEDEIKDIDAMMMDEESSLELLDMTQHILSPVLMQKKDTLAKIARQEKKIAKLNKELGKDVADKGVGPVVINPVKDTKDKDKDINPQGKDTKAITLEDTEKLMVYLTYAKRIYDEVEFTNADTTIPEEKKKTLVNVYLGEARSLVKAAIDINKAALLPNDAANVLEGKDIDEIFKNGVNTFGVYDLNTVPEDKKVFYGKEVDKVLAQEQERQFKKVNDLIESNEHIKKVAGNLQLDKARKQMKELVVMNKLMSLQAMGFDISYAKESENLIKVERLGKYISDGKVPNTVVISEPKPEELSPRFAYPDKRTTDQINKIIKAISKEAEETPTIDEISVGLIDVDKAFEDEKTAKEKTDEDKKIKNIVNFKSIDELVETLERETEYGKDGRYPELDEIKSTVPSIETIERILADEARFTHTQEQIASLKTFDRIKAKSLQKRYYKEIEKTYGYTSEEWNRRLNLYHKIKGEYDIAKLLQEFQTQEDLIDSIQTIDQLKSPEVADKLAAAGITETVIFSNAELQDENGEIVEDAAQLKGKESFIIDRKALDKVYGFNNIAFARSDVEETDGHYYQELVSDNGVKLQANLISFMDVDATVGIRRDALVAYEKQSEVLKANEGAALEMMDSLVEAIKNVQADLAETFGVDEFEFDVTTDEGQDQGQGQDLGDGEPVQAPGNDEQDAEL